MTPLLACCAVSLVIAPPQAQTFRVAPLRSIAELREQALAARPSRQLATGRGPELVDLLTLDPDLKLDIRYAGTNNFLGTPVYTEARAFLERPAAEALVAVDRSLHTLGYGLVIFDAYRPWYVTKIFWDATPRPLHRFLSDPAHGSQHNRGMAVDLSLFDLRTGQEVEMPSGYDEMTPRAYAGYPGGPADARRLRGVLRHAMEAQGFHANPTEWWHFTYRGAHLYPVLNLRFEDVGR